MSLKNINKEEYIWNNSDYCTGIYNNGKCVGEGINAYSAKCLTRIHNEIVDKLIEEINKLKNKC